MKKFSLQNVSSVEFATDINTGAIAYASFGGCDDSRQVVEIAADSEFGGHAHLLVLWVAGVCFGLKNAVNDFITAIRPIVRDRFIQCQGWVSTDDVTDVIVNVWQKMTGNAPKGGQPYNPAKSMISTYLAWQVAAFMQEKGRENDRSKKFLSLSKVGRDSDIELSSIGSKSMFGLTFEPSDPDVAPSKWTKMSAKSDPTFDRMVRKEESAGLRKVLRKLPSRNAQALALYFVKEMTLANIGVQMSMTSMGVLKMVVRTLNVMRRHYGIEGDIISLGGKNRIVKSIDLDNIDEEVVIRTELSREWVALRDLSVVCKFAKKADAKEYANKSKCVIDIVSMVKN